MKSGFSHMFLLVILVSPLPIMGNLQNVFALTPVADLTGDWSGFAQLANVEGICEFSGKVNANIKQDGNTLVGGYSFVTTNVKTNDPDNMGFECQNFDYQENFRGTLDGSRITLNSDGGGVFTGWYASSGIKLDLQSDELVGTAQLSPTNFTPPAFEQTPKDSDGDGIFDSTDSCPTQAETVNGFEDTDGCPDVVPPTDSDGDGILDTDDSCPDESGTARFNGCPEKDSDGDGIYDFQDECVYEAEDIIGDTDGCPDVVPSKQTTPEKVPKNPPEVETELDEGITEIKNNIAPKDWAEDLPIAGDAPNIVFPTRIPDNFFRANGCGSQRERGVDVPDFDFAESCNQHDICYARGGDADDRKICDDEMYESVKSNSVLGKFGATIYYWGVRLGGASSFNCASDSC